VTKRRHTFDNTHVLVKLVEM